MSSTMKKPIKIIFDLDDVLVSAMSEREYKSIAQKIGQDSTIDSCGDCYYLFNGWKELIKYVMELTGNNLVFFSSGTRERNDDIIPKILERVLERDPTEYIKNHVKIFSREHTLDLSRMSLKERMKFHPNGILFGTRKKDLTVAVSVEELKYTLIIDDMEGVIVLGQEKNLLKLDVKYVDYELYNCMKLPDDLDVTNENVLDKEVGQDYFYTANKLFYAAGVLKDVYDAYSKVDDRDLIDIMWERHGFKDELDDSGCIVSYRYRKLERIELYQSGREVLRKFNGDATFLVPAKRLGG